MLKVVAAFFVIFVLFDSAVKGGSNLSILPTCICYQWEFPDFAVTSAECDDDESCIDAMDCPQRKLLMKNPRKICSVLMNEV
jgi:hypothetical protein